jgi:hypothetical protein
MAIYSVPVKGGGKIDIDTEKLNDDMFAALVYEGLAVVLSKGPGASKITKGNYANASEYEAAGVASAEKQRDVLYAGEYAPRGTKKAKTGVPAAVMTEARRRAKNLLKDQYKRDGGKPSQVDGKDWTIAANLYLETPDGVAIIAEVKEIMAQSKTKPAAVPSNILAGIKPSEKLIAKAEKKKAEAKVDKDQASAKQAGKVETKTKPATKPAMKPVPPAKPAATQHAAH